MKRLFFLIMALSTFIMYGQAQEREELRFKHTYIKFEYDDGKYMGEALNGKPHGEGLIFYDESIDPIRMRYAGSWVDGKRQGKGVMRWRNGDTYDGYWENGLENGEGKCYYANGDKYVGEWKDGEENGEGTCYYADGSKYEGHWENGLWNGKGCYTRDDRIYELTWTSKIEQNTMKIVGKDENGNSTFVLYWSMSDAPENIGAVELHKSYMRRFKKYVNER